MGTAKCSLAAHEIALLINVTQRRKVIIITSHYNHCRPSRGSCCYLWEIQAPFSHLSAERWGGGGEGGTHYTDGEDEAGEVPPKPVKCRLKDLNLGESRPGSQEGS